MVDIWDKLTNSIRKKDVKLGFLFMFIAIIIFMIQNYSVLLNILTVVTDVSKIALKHILVLIVIFLLACVFEILMKKSDEECQKDIDLYYSKMVSDTPEKYGVSFSVVEDYDKTKFYRTILKCYLINKNSTVEYINGIISFYDTLHNSNRSICLLKVPFEIWNFKQDTIEILFNDYISINWTHYSVFLKEFKKGSEIYKNKEIESKYLIRTHAIDYNYNHYYDYNLFGFKSKYNLVWLKEKIKLVRYIIRHFYSAKKIYFNVEIPFCDKFISPIVRILKRILVYALLIVIISIGIMLLTDIWKMLGEIMTYIIKRSSIVV